MRKILLASTALAISAGFAAAEVSLSGSAEMGIRGGSGYTGDKASKNETQFESNVDVRFTLSNTTDNGLTFGATIDLDEAGDSQKNSKEAVFVSGTFGTITLGDTDGAFDWALTEVGSGAALTDDHTSHAGYSGNGGLDGAHDGQVLRWNYSFGNFGVAVSAELNDDPTVGTPTAITSASGLPGSVSVPAMLDADTDGVEVADVTARDQVIAGAQAINNAAVTAANNAAVTAANNANRLAAADNVYGIGTTYSMDVGSGSVGFGLSYQSGGRTADRPGAFAVLKENTFGLSLSGNFGGGFSGVLNYSKGDGTTVDARDAVTAMDASGVTPAVTESAAGAKVDVTHMGIGVAYQLDALLLHANYGENEVDGVKKTGWGVAANYALGGGASAQFGYGNGEGKSTWSLGLAMSF